MMRSRLIVTAAVALGVAGLATGCGGTDHSAHQGSGAKPTAASSAAPAADRNEQDAAFATDMIMHHRQAVEMADLIPSRSTDAKVIALGERIKAAQQPEIDMMSGWLTTWAIPVPGDMSGMDHSDMPGMMSPEDMTELAGLKGAEFDKKFLTMMIAHHEGALTMAKDQLAKGQFADAKKLAEGIIGSQTTEIAEMKGMMG